MCVLRNAVEPPGLLVVWMRILATINQRPVYIGLLQLKDTGQMAHVRPYLNKLRALSCSDQEVANENSNRNGHTRC